MNFLLCVFVPAIGLCWSLSINLKGLVQLTTILSYAYWSWKTEGRIIYKASVVIPIMQVAVKLVDPLSSVTYVAHAMVESIVSIGRVQRFLFGQGLEVIQPELKAFTTSPSTEATETLYKTEFQKHRRKRTESPGGNNGEADETTRLLSAPASPATTAGVALASLNASDDVLSKKQRTAAPGAPDKLKYIEVKEAEFIWKSKFKENIQIQNRGGGYSTEEQEQPEGFKVTIDKLNISKGECVFLLGKPGNGKTSVLLALLGEMPKVSGSLYISRVPYHNNYNSICVDDSAPAADSALPADSGDAVGFCSQIPWVSEGDVRSAILFGRTFNAERYNRITKACCLDEVNKI